MIPHRIILHVAALIIGLLSQSHGMALDKTPTAKFSFNGLKDYDEISLKKIRMVGASYVPDRFGNENNALFVYGNWQSYINLGSYPALKPETGSISLWTRMEHPVWYGKGTPYNPIIITKYTQENDYYESYSIYYMLKSEKLLVTMVQDSTKEATVFSSSFALNLWQHLVITFNDDSLALYLNGKLQNKLSKKFKTRYLASDSVVLGHSANKKNARFFSGLIDDVEFYDSVLSPDEVMALYQAPNPNRNKVILNWTLAGLGIVLGLLLLLILVRYQVKKGIQKEKKRFEFNNLILETELRVNRALMNPHFVFNSLNTLQNFILKKEHHIAHDYLVRFSKLLRKVLESNNSGIISLELEVDLLTRYLEIENLRFEKNILYTVSIDERLNAATMHIPIMMLQPFLENAIWHGLLKKEGEKTLHLSFNYHDARSLQCVIDDNGLGRKKSTIANTGKKSLGIGFIIQRLKLLNKIHNLNCSLTIYDKENESGTTIIITLPILNK